MTPKEIQVNRLSPAIFVFITVAISEIIAFDFFTAQYATDLC